MPFNTNPGYASETSQGEHRRKILFSALNVLGLRQTQFPLPVDIQSPHLQTQPTNPLAMVERVGVLSGPFRPAETENDYPVPGRLSGWSATWRHGWACSGLRWPWVGGPHGRPSPSHSLTIRVQELLYQNVIEQAHGRVFLNRLRSQNGTQPSQEDQNPAVAHEVCHMINGALALLGNANYRNNVTRRFIIKREINQKYAHLCSEKVPMARFLFRDDLSIGETN